MPVRTWPVTVTGTRGHCRAGLDFLPPLLANFALATDGCDFPCSHLEQ